MRPSRCLWCSCRCCVGMSSSQAESCTGHRQDPVVSDSPSCIDAALPGTRIAWVGRVGYRGSRAEHALQSWEPLHLAWQNFPAHVVGLPSPKNFLRAKRDNKIDTKQKWPQVTNLCEEESSCGSQSHHISRKTCVAMCGKSTRQHVFFIGTMICTLLTLMSAWNASE